MKTPHDDDNDRRMSQRRRGEIDETVAARRVRQRLWFVSAITLVMCIVGISWFPGCTNSEIPIGDTPEKSTEECYNTLTSALENANPSKLGLTTAIDHAVSRLNDWYIECGKKVDVDVNLKPETQKQLAKLLSEDELKSITSDNFSNRDVRHIRNSLLMKEMVKFAPGLSDNDLERSVDLFYYVVRNIELIERPKDSVSLPPFRILLLGRGTAEDRAWIFSGLLRQLRITTVILRPSSAAGKAGNGKSPFLVGVLLNKNVYLFDTRLGLPIPSTNSDKETTPMIRRPATLEEFISDASIQKSLNVGDFKYDISGDDLKQPGVQLIGHRSLWSERMKKLNYSVIGKEKPILFDELDADTDGVIARIAEFGGKRWTDKQIGIWPYPEEGFRGFENRTDKQSLELTELQLPLSMPISVTFDKETKSIQIGRGSSEQRQARILQLMGNYREAIKLFISVRSRCLKSPAELDQLQPRTLKALNIALEDGWVWIATAKLEQQDNSMIPWYETQSKQYRDSKRFDHAKYLVALGYRQVNKFNAAFTILEGVPDSHPQKHGFMLLVQRWRKQNSSQKKAGAKT